MSVMAGGGETTLEDRIIYDEYIMPLIDVAERDIRDRVTVDGFPSNLRMKLEQLVYAVVKHERGL